MVNYEGNINFAKEKHVVDFMRTSGRDLNVHNPYVEKTVAMSNFDEIRARILDLCAREENGLRALRLLFNKFDANRNGSLEAVEFKRAMEHFGMSLSELEVSQVLKYFDSNGDGKISFEEFLTAVRGDLSEARRDIVHQAFFSVDRSMSGTCTLA